MRKETFWGNYARLVTVFALLTPINATTPRPDDEQPLKLEIISQRPDEIFLGLKTTTLKKITLEKTAIIMAQDDVPPEKTQTQTENSEVFLNRGIQPIAPPTHSHEHLPL